MPHVPALCLVDGDPFGLEIYATYRYGSIALSREVNCTAANLQWIGVAASDLAQLGVAASCSETLTERDDSKLATLRSRTCLEHDPLIKMQLDQMLSSRQKVSIEALYSLGIATAEAYLNNVCRHHVDSMAANFDERHL